MPAALDQLLRRCLGHQVVDDADVVAFGEHLELVGPFHDLDHSHGAFDVGTSTLGGPRGPATANPRKAAIVWFPSHRRTKPPDSAASESFRVLPALSALPHQGRP